MQKQVTLGVLAVLILLGSLFYQWGYMLGPDPFDLIAYNRGHVPTDSEEYVLLLKAQSKAWGLGNTLKAYYSVDRDYGWYVDQANTGLHSNSNCGPSTLAMAIKWYKEDSEFDASWARLYRNPLGGPWYDEDIQATLQRFDIPYKRYAISDSKQLVDLIKQDQILIVINQMGSIPTGQQGTRTNRFYTFTGGHILLIKGFAQVDATLYFQVYDPNNWGMTYEDGQPMGKDRYYEASALLRSVQGWHPYVFAIEGPSD